MFVRQWGLITHKLSPPSPWVERFLEMIAPSQATSSRILDYACGTGRHTRLCQQLGYKVLAIDYDQASLQVIAESFGQCQPKEIELRCTDLELEEFAFAHDAEKFSGLIVTNYLYRPHLSSLLDVLMVGGVFIYETFALGNERFGKPSNPHFLLKENELLEAVMAKNSFKIIAFESMMVEEPKPAMIQRICAVRTRDWATIL